MKISIIIPTFNRLWSLPQAILSCRSETLETEIIVVDDGSTDGTWAWLQEQDDLIALHQENWGKPWAVNQALEIATGDYIRFLDSDDWLEPEANERQLQIAQSDNVDLVVSGYRIYNENGESVGVNPWQPCDDFIAQQLGECNNSHYSAYLFRRTFLTELCHRPDFAFRDDRMFVLEAALANPSVAICPGYTLAHRHHSKPRLQASTGLRSIVTHWQQLTLYRKIISILESRAELTPRRQKAAAKMLWPLAHWIAYTQISEGLSVADWVYELDPEFIPPESGALGFCYRTLGFYWTEILLKIRRELKASVRLIWPSRLTVFSP